MRKIVCTASLFAAMVAGVIAGFVVHVPHKWAWTLSLIGDPDNGPVTLGVAVLFGIGLPLDALFITGLVLFGLWEAASHLCDKLRGTRED